MAFENLLDTDSLLGTIAVLLGILNINQQRTKIVMSIISKRIGILGRYLKEDIQIRARLENKANWLMDKMGVDIEKFNIDVAHDIDMDIDQLTDLELEEFVDK